MDVALEIAKDNSTVRNEIHRELTEFKKQNISSQAKKGEQLTVMMPAVKQAFIMLRDDNYELVIENNLLYSKLGEVDLEWVRISKDRLIASSVDEDKNKVLLERMRNKTKN